MKRLCFVVILVVSLLMTNALADSRTVEYTAAHINHRWICETFDSQMNADAQTAFSARLLPDDQIICGVEMVYYNHQTPDDPFRKDILMAVKRADKMLMFAAKTSNNGWRTSIESDSFLPVDGNFEITVRPEHSGSEAVKVEARPYMAIVCGNEEWEVVVDGDLKVRLDSYTHKIDDNTSLHLTMSFPSNEANFGVAIFENGECVSEEEFACVFPERIAAWTMDEFPGTLEELRDFEAAYQADVEAGEGYITGVNLRKEPTGKSASMGEYVAKVKVLGSVPGEKEPWYNVQVGDLEGWVSSRYLVQDNKRRLCESEREMVPIARADSDLLLKSASTGEVIATVSAGTLMHVIHDMGDTLHVVIPQGELTWKTDWDGTYGLVTADGVTVSISAADLKWK